MCDILIDTLKDGLKLLPFLFFSFLVIELFEHKFSKKTKKIINKSGNPIIGSLLGVIPQCGFSVVATNLYVTRVISIGTLISIYLTTSDEMIPVLISNNVSFSTILTIIIIKIFIGMISGVIIDLFLRKKDGANYHICDSDKCHCESGIVVSTIKHTLKTLMIILIVTFILSICFDVFKIPISDKGNVFAPLLLSLFGFIPTCATSVLTTQLYVDNVLSLGSLISSLLTNSGVALIVLFKENDLKDTLKIMGILYLIGSICGIVINLI